MRSSRRSRRSNSKHTTQINLHTDKTWFQGPSFAAAGTLSLTHNNTHGSAYRQRYSCPATHITPSRARTSRDARRVSSESSPVRERRTLLTYTSTRQERDYRGPSTWCANARTRTCASSAYLASRDVAAERRETVEASLKSFVALETPASASTGSSGGKHNTPLLIRSLPSWNARTT
jgi:hypothetical protein